MCRDDPFFSDVRVFMQKRKQERKKELLFIYTNVLHIVHYIEKRYFKGKGYTVRGGKMVLVSLLKKSPF